MRHCLTCTCAVIVTAHRESAYGRALFNVNGGPTLGWAETFRTLQRAGIADPFAVMNEALDNYEGPIT